MTAPRARPDGARSAPWARLLRGLGSLAVVAAGVLLVSSVVQAMPERQLGALWRGEGAGPGYLLDRHSGLERLRSTHDPAGTDQDGQQVATLQGHAAEAFEPLAFESSNDGRIEPNRAWVDEHIVTADVPLLAGRVRCHERLITQLEGALGELEERDLGHLIDPDQYGGCWVPRHILSDPDRALSLHAWGLAVDFNVADNPYGAEPQMDHRVVDVFERWGFAWGGRWRTPDGMHFELVELREEPRAEGG